MEQAVIPGRLEVVLKNVVAAREIYAYIIGDDIDHDVLSFRQALLGHLSQSIQIPAGWRRPYIEDASICLHPEKKWKASGKHAISIEIILPSPVAIQDDDQDASVDLRVPFSGKLLKHVTDLLRPLVPPGKDWVHIQDVESGETIPELPVFKWIRYNEYCDGAVFDTTSFLEAIASAVNDLLQLEDQIDQVFEQAKATIAPRPNRRKHPERKRRKT